MKIIIRSLFGVMPVALMLWACTDEIIKEIEVKGETIYDTLDVPPLQGNRIIEYNITNTTVPIYSAIDDQAKTITVYLPHYNQLEVIDPEIILPEGATIVPASRDIIEVFGDPVTYTVTTKDGQRATYKLNIEIQQPDIILDEWSTEQDTLEHVINGIVTIHGENFIPNLDITKTYIIDENGTEIPLEVVSGGYYSNEISYFGSGLAEKLKVGSMYWIEMRAYSLKKRMKYPFRAVYPPATLNIALNATRKQGETFTLSATYLEESDLTEFAIRTDGVNYAPLVIESSTQTQVTIRIPDNYPTGTFGAGVRLRTTLEGLTSENRNSSGTFTLIVQPK